MSRPALGPSIAAVPAPGVEAWSPLTAHEGRLPDVLRPWLAEPGLLTARVRAACGDAMSLRLLRLERAPLSPRLRCVLGVDDPDCLLREVEIGCGETRWIFAQSVFPESTVRRYPWLADLGDKGLGESLARVADVKREPLEYLELPNSHELARAVPGTPESSRSLWARRAVYRLGGWPILVQEVFLPALGCCD